MAYLDEDIARMLRNERKKEKLKMEQEQLKKEMESIDEEKIATDMEKGFCVVLDREFKFQQKNILANKMQVFLPDGNLIERCNFAEMYTAGDDRYEMGINYVLAQEKEEFQSWEVYKTNMEEGLKKSKIRFNWIEEGCILNRQIKLHYLEYLTTTGMGVIHNHMYMADLGEERLTVNLNYLDKDQKYWKVLVKIMMDKMQWLG